MPRPRLRMLLFLTSFILAGSPSRAAPGQIAPSFGEPQAVSLADLRPHLADEEWYKETWNFNAWTADGAFVAVDFVISNVGIGDHNGLFRAKYIDRQGRKTVCKAELDDDEWTYGKTSFALNFGKARASGDLNGFDVRVACKKLGMTLRFDNQAPPFKPGTGRLRYAQGGFYIKNYPSARAQVTGTIQNGEQRLTLAAPGLVVHSASNISPEVSSRRMFLFRSVNAAMTMILTELELPRKQGGARRGWAMVYGPQGKLLASTDVKFVFDDYVTDEKSDEKYQYPGRVSLSAADGDARLSGQLRMTSLNKSRDPTSNLNFATRALVRRYTKPMDYAIGCRYDLKLETNGQSQTLSGLGEYRFMYVNP